MPEHGRAHSETVATSRHFAAVAFPEEGHHRCIHQVADIDSLAAEVAAYFDIASIIGVDVVDAAEGSRSSTDSLAFTGSCWVVPEEATMAVGPYLPNYLEFDPFLHKKYLVVLI